MTVSTRDFVSIKDLPIIAKFFDEARDLVGHTQGFLHAGDVWWRYGRTEPETHQFRLWFQNEKLIAFGWVISGQSLEIQLHPSLTDTDFDSLARAIVDWAKRVCPTEISTDCTASNSRLIRVLELCGFTRAEYEGLDYVLDLKAPLPDLNLPAGFQARHVLETEFEERVSVHRDAFDPSKFSLERYARVRSMAGYRSDLDLVISTPENEFAANCIAWISNGMGYFEPVGTRAAYRRQGLGRAVILEGLRRLKTLGAHSASVFSFANNRAFYESCGFVVVNHWQGYAFKQEADSGS
jgi:GNAT superfamily N-acetyltransferase